MSRSIRAKWEADALLIKARAAGAWAAAAAHPTPMVVYDADPLTGLPAAGGRVYNVAEGPCGFGWVVVRPARGRFVAACKRAGDGWLSHSGGWHLPARVDSQSVERAEAYARAMAQVLRDAGLNATSHSRLD